MQNLLKENLSTGDQSDNSIERKLSSEIGRKLSNEEVQQAMHDLIAIDMKNSN